MDPGELRWAAECWKGPWFAHGCYPSHSQSSLHSQWHQGAFSVPSLPEANQSQVLLCKDSLGQAYPRCSLCLWLHSAFLSVEEMSILSLFPIERNLGHRAVGSRFSHGEYKVEPELKSRYVWLQSHTLCVTSASSEAILFILMNLLQPVIYYHRLNWAPVSASKAREAQGWTGTGVSSGCWFSSLYVKVSTLHPLGLAVSLRGP